MKFVTKVSPKANVIWKSAKLVLLGTLIMNGIPGALPGFAQDSSYRDMGNALSPSQLNQLLSNSDAVVNNKISNKLAELVKEKFKNLPQESKERIAELGKKFARNGSSFNLESQKRGLERELQRDPEILKAVDELKKEFDPKQLRKISPWDLEKKFRSEIRQSLSEQIQKAPSTINQVDPKDPDIFQGTGVNGKGPTVGGNQNGKGVKGTGRPINNSGLGPGGTQSNGNGSSKSGGNQTQKGVAGGQQTTGGNGNQNGTSSRPQQLPDTTTGSSNRGGEGGGEDDLPSEKIGHRFNRLLVKSLEKAVEKKLDREMADSADGRSSFDRFVERLAGSLGNRDSSSGVSSGADWLVDRTKQLVNRTRSKRGGQGFSFSSAGFSAPSFSFPEFSARDMLFFLLVLAAIVVTIVLIVQRTPLSTVLGLRSPAKNQVSPPQIKRAPQSHGEIVETMDRLTLWIFGQRADWWNSQKVRTEMATQHPELRTEIEAVMRAYDQFRYQPGTVELSPDLSSVAQKALTYLAAQPGFNPFQGSQVES